MTINIQELYANQENAQRAFGEMIKQWYRKNGWKKYTLSAWAEYAGFYFVPYGIIEELWAGEEVNLTKEDFEAFGDVNNRLAMKNFGSIPQLSKLTSVLDKSVWVGTIIKTWKAEDFWACYHGLIEVPAWMNRDN
jgi:hypothetical protein